VSWKKLFSFFGRSKAVPQRPRRQKSVFLELQELEPRLVMSTFQFVETSITHNENYGTVAFNVTRGDDTSGAATVSISLANVTTNPNDYEYLYSNPTTLEFSDSMSTATVHVTIIDDAAVESTETLQLTLSNPSGGYTIPSNGMTATLTIQDNDTSSGTIKFGTSSYTVSEGVGTATLSVERTNTSGSASVFYAPSATEGTATGNDYTNASGTLYFSDGQATASLSITVINDQAVEGDEWLRLLLSNPSSGYTIDSNLGSATLNITDNDNGSIHFSTGSYTVSEGVGHATVTLERTSTIGSATVHFRTEQGSAVPSQDYGSITDDTATFAAGQLTTTFSVTITDDGAVENSEYPRRSTSRTTTPARSSSAHPATPSAKGWATSPSRWNAPPTAVRPRCGSLRPTARPPPARATTTARCCSK
jgi:hypothetical protein